MPFIKNFDPLNGTATLFDNTRVQPERFHGGAHMHVEYGLDLLWRRIYGVNPWPRVETVHFDCTSDGIQEGQVESLYIPVFLSDYEEAFKELRENDVCLQDPVAESYGHMRIRCQLHPFRHWNENFVEEWMEMLKVAMAMPRPE